MANFNLYFASCVLLLTLSWHTSTGHPVPTVTLSTEKCAECSSLFRDLLLNIRELLKSEVLRFGIKTEKAPLVLNTTETLLACTPTLTQNGGCMIQRNSSFSESECLKNIMMDLAYYNATIKSYIETTLRDEEEITLLSPTLALIKRLRENCSLNGENGENDSYKLGPHVQWGNDTFDNRQKMWKILRGFYIRTITINRAMGYISSGDHRK